MRFHLHKISNVHLILGPLKNLYSYKYCQHFLYALFLLCLSTKAVAYPSAQGNVDYVQLNGRGFLITYDDKDATLGYYLSLPFNLKNIFWDDPTSHMHLIMGSQSPTPEELLQMKSHFFLRKLYPLPIENLSIAWDDFLLSSSDYKILWSSLEPLDDIQIVYKLTPLRYEKLKERFNQKIPFSVSGQIDLSYRSTSIPTITTTQIIRTDLPTSPQVLIYYQTQNQLRHTQLFFSLF